MLSNKIHTAINDEMDQPGSPDTAATRERTESKGGLCAGFVIEESDESDNTEVNQDEPK